MQSTNEIYHHTRSSLMTIVSANVADHTLESVLQESGLNQETVSADHMMELIRGPIYREFQTIVPKEGLKRQLTKLLGELQKVNEEPVFGLVGISQVPKSAEKAKQQRNAQANAKEKESAPKRARVPGLTKIKANAIGVPRAYFRDPRDDPFNIQMPLFGTDPHVVLDNGTRAILRYWISEVGFLDPDELKKAGFRRYSFMVEEESHPNPTIVRLLQMLREEEEAEQESLMLERLAQDAKEAAERDIAEKAEAEAKQAEQSLQITQEDIEVLMGDFAELEDVRYLAMLKHDGEVLKTKGRALEIESLKPVLLESVKGLSAESFETKYPEELEQFSNCKSILLQHQSGLLFVLNFSEMIVVVYGNTDLNIGLIYSYASRVGKQKMDSENAASLSDEDFKDVA